MPMCWGVMVGAWEAGHIADGAGGARGWSWLYHVPEGSEQRLECGRGLALGSGIIRDFHFPLWASIFFPSSTINMHFIY